MGKMIFWRFASAAFYSIISGRIFQSFNRKNEYLFIIVCFCKFFLSKKARAGFFYYITPCIKRGKIEKRTAFFPKPLDSAFAFTIYYLIAGFSVGAPILEIPRSVQLAFEKEGFECYGLISRRSGRERKNTDFARECRIATAAKCWLAAERRAENALPTKRQGEALSSLSGHFAR